MLRPAAFGRLTVLTLFALMVAVGGCATNGGGSAPDELGGLAGGDGQAAALGLVIQAGAGSTAETTVDALLSEVRDAGQVAHEFRAADGTPRDCVEFAKLADLEAARTRLCGIIKEAAADNTSAAAIMHAVVLHCSQQAVDTALTADGGC